MTWLQQIEALKPGDLCEFRYLSRNHVDEVNGDHHPAGQLVKGIYIEQVRPVGDERAWT